MPRIFGFLILFSFNCLFLFSAHAYEPYYSEAEEFTDISSSEELHDHEGSFDELNSLWDIEAMACSPATAKNISVINSGNGKLNRFLSQCVTATNGSSWCSQLIRPNPASVQTFKCTYGVNQPHQLIHPDEATWTNAFKAVKFVDQLQSMGVQVAEIYNWWRPEPYNANVGGAAGRHPFGTSIDVRFKTLTDMERAHTQLCKWRKAGLIRAVGYYGSTGLHFGIGDQTANTWGKSCP